MYMLLRCDFKFEHVHAYVLKYVECSTWHVSCVVWFV